jgi:hypothetical protein
VAAVAGAAHEKEGDPVRREPLTGPQSEIVRIVARANIEHKAPTWRELAAEKGVTSLNSIACLLQCAKAKGAIATGGFRSNRTMTCALPIVTSREGVVGFMEMFQ